MARTSDLSTRSHNAETKELPGSRTSLLSQVLANRGFVLCTLLLIVLVVSFQAIVRARNIQFHKLAVELKKPLKLLDQTRLVRPLFELDPSVRKKLYTGRISLGLRNAMAEHGLSLSPDSEVSTKKPGELYEISEPARPNAPQSTYLVRTGQADKPLTVLAPYELLRASEIKGEVLDSLGTDKYIQWALEDHSNPDPTDPARYIQLFITYYTGTRDQVPHVPEVCYVGGGYQIEDEWFVDVPVPELGPDEQVTAKVLQFRRPRFVKQGKKIVMYLFHTNGQFCPDRMCTRLALSDPSHRHAYFSKVEMTFGTPQVLPTREQAIAAGKRFFRVILPVMVRDHWPDWEKVKQAERQSASTR
jgi:hypothetical protein